MKKFLKDEKVLCFLGGMAATVIGAKILKSKATKNACVKVVASGMKLQQDAQVALEEIREEAEDIVYEAKELNNTESIEEDK